MCMFFQNRGMYFNNFHPKYPMNSHPICFDVDIFYPHQLTLAERCPSSPASAPVYQWFLQKLQVPLHDAQCKRPRFIGRPVQRPNLWKGHRWKSYDPENFWGATLRLQNCWYLALVNLTVGNHSFCPYSIIDCNRSVYYCMGRPWNMMDCFEFVPVTPS